MGHTTPSDNRHSPVEALALRARTDQDAFVQLYEKYADKLCRYISTMIRDRSLVDDISQDAWIRVHSILKTTYISNADGGGFEGLLFVTARRLCIDTGKRAYRKRESIGLDHIALDEASSDLTPEEVAERNEVRAMVARGLSRLKPKYRQVLICRFHDDMSVNETAVALGIKPNTVKSHQHRGLNVIRESLRACPNGGKMELPLLILAEEFGRTVPEEV